MGTVETRELAVSFGGLRAVDGLSITVGEGELVGLIGPNGAGKTTTIDAVTGFVPHTGRVLLDGTDLSEAPPHIRVQAGLARTWQSMELFEDLTVIQNCQVAADHRSSSSMFLDVVRPRRSRSTKGVDGALSMLGLEDVAHRLPGQLSQGRQKLVGVARAMSSGPSVLLLDEPAAGLDTEESRALGSDLRTVVEHGTSILLIDHDTRLVLDVCDRMYVLDFGLLVAEGTPDEIRADERVIEAYLGASTPDGATRAGTDE